VTDEAGTNTLEEIANWWLTNLLTRPIKIGARVVRHARTIISQLAKIAIGSKNRHNMQVMAFHLGNV